ncbi:MAG TPA: long-chain fatty acid--CoA ligase [Planctomycetaceae bacterium]|nr:long-chain fatty acid--CoA ligase [Planctomycetaceae bacterium]
MKYSNLCTMHRSQCGALGPRTALRYKRNGLYHEVTWSDYRWMADRAAAGLIELGVRYGDRVAILSENRYEWMVADQAILSTGAADVPLHAPLAPRQVEYQVGHSESRGIIVSNQEQADKVFEVLSALPNLEFLVSFCQVTAPRSAKIRVLTFDGLMQRGAQAHLENQILAREAEVTGDDLATIIYTSGTTGNPKGVMLTHRNLVLNAETTLEIGPQPPTDVLLSWLPYSHIYARTCDLYVPVMAGSTVALAESMDTLVLNLAETRPSTLTSVPRFYEKVWTRVEQLPPNARAAALKKIFGPRIRQLSSGGAPLPKHVCQGFFEAGLPLLEGYGLTETSPVVSFNTVDNYRIGTVGRAIPGVEIKIARDGEILVRGPNVMKGYWRNPEATAEAIEKDGWFHTGDVGHLDADGYLSITDRKKDLIITSAGKNIAPSELERLLVSDIYIDQAVVYGDGRRFVSAIVVPNFEQLRQKAAELRCTLDSTPDGFIDVPCIHEFLAQRIDAVMQHVSNPERVKKFLVLDRPFQVDADELTATLKVRRNHIIGKYEPKLAALYEN